MWDIKACRVCFKSDGVLHSIGSGHLKREFFLVSGLKTTDSAGMPQYLCVECSAYVRRSKKFRDKCMRAHFALKEILKRNKEIKLTNLLSINCKQIGIKSQLSYLDLNRTHYEQIQFHWQRHNRLSLPKVDENIGIFHCSTFTLQDESEVPAKRQKLSDSVNENIVKLENDEPYNTLQEFHVGDSNDRSFLEPSMVIENVESISENYFNNDENFASDNDEVQELDSYPCKEEDKSEHVDGMNLDEEYASIVPISENEAKAATEVYKLFSTGKHRCPTCMKSFFNENRYKIHLRMHDQHTSGNYFCSLCHFYYKTDFLLKTHMTEKHLYKYLCRKCPEVNFDRISAKQHFIWTHLQSGSKKDSVWYDSRPSWLSPRGGKRVKGVVSLRPVRKIIKLPPDFPVYSPVSQEEQYQLVRERMKTRNYMEAQYKCQFCYKGFREAETYGKHMRKHDPTLSGPLQCDMCKLHFRDARKVYKHMNITHLFKYSCQMCTYVCYNRGQAHMHYRWHKNVTYECPHCKRDFKKASTRLTHIRIKHPSTYICNLCGHSYVSENGLYCHKKLAHSAEEIEASESTPVDTEDVHYCADCNVHFMSEAAYKTHLGSSNKHASTNVSVKPVRLTRAAADRKRRGRPRTNWSNEIVNNGLPTATHCEVCGKFLSNDVQARKHYEAEHPGAEFLKRYMCDVCGHTTKQYANLMVHMRTHTNEKPYGCPHCERRFSMPSNRDRHLVVHTGEKRYQCQHCNRRFTQSSAVKLHIQTVHLKIPYAPWDKKNRKRRKLEATSAIVSSMASSASVSLQPPQPKLLLDAQSDYLNAYITYNDE